MQRTWDERVAAAVARVEARLDRSDSFDCWLWPGARNNNRINRHAYGVVSIPTGEGKKVRTFYVHRLLYQHHVGPIPEGLEVDHLCNIKICVNPDHMELVTHAENMRRISSR